MLMKTRPESKPIRGPKYRSRAFQEYLLEQTPERRAEILAGEREYNEMRKDPGTVSMAAERVMLDTLEGYVDPPAGITEAHRAHNFNPLFTPNGGHLTRHE